METSTRKTIGARESCSKNVEDMSLDVTSSKTSLLATTRRHHSNDSSQSRSSSYSSHSSNRHSSPDAGKLSGSGSESSDDEARQKVKRKKRRSSSSEDSTDNAGTTKKSKTSSVRNVRSFRKRSSSRSQSRSPSREKYSDVDLKRSSDLEKHTSHSSERELENCADIKNPKKVPSKESYVNNSRRNNSSKSRERSPFTLTRGSKERSCSVDSRLEKSTSREPSSKHKDRSPHSDQLSKTSDRLHLTEKAKRDKDVDRRSSRSRDRRSHRSYKSRSRSRSRDRRSRSKRRSYRSRRDDSPRRRRSRSRDRYSYRRRASPRKRRSRSRDRSRSREHRHRSHSRSGSRDRPRHRYHRRRSSSHDGYRRRLTVSRSRSPSHSRLSSREKSKSDLVTTSTSLGSLPLSTTTGAMTPQMALQQTMAQMSAKAQALTGIALPKYYNPAAVNPLKYAEQVQKRKLLWQTKDKPEEQPKSSVWDKLKFSQDDDGRMTAKFRKLMGIKGQSAGEKPPEGEVKHVDESALKKQEELFRNLDQQYEMARMSTHTHRGVGLGYTSQAIFPPIQK